MTVILIGEIITKGLPVLGRGNDRTFNPVAI
jgi:hypothetical protein